MPGIHANRYNVERSENPLKISYINRKELNQKFYSRWEVSREIAVVRVAYKRGAR